MVHAELNDRPPPRRAPREAGALGVGAKQALTGPLTFAPGETTKTITIEVEGGSKREANETFYLDLYGISINGLFTKDRGIGTILNDD